MPYLMAEATEPPAVIRHIDSMKETRNLDNVRKAGLHPPEVVEAADQ